MKKFTKIVVVALVVIMVLAVASTAFANGERIDFDGRYVYGFTSNASLPQKSDRTVQMHNDDTYVTRGTYNYDPNRATFYVVDSSGNTQSDCYANLLRGQSINSHVDPVNSVRRLHIRIDNTGKDTAQRRTVGHAILYSAYLN